MKKSLLLMATLAVTSIVLLVIPESEENHSSPELGNAKTPFHIFREKGKSEKKTMKARPSKRKKDNQYKTRWVKTKKAHTKVRHEKNQMDEFVAEQPKRLMSDEEFRSTMKPVTAKKAGPQIKAPQKESAPWVPKLSGGDANVTLAKTTKEKQKCIQENCSGDKKTINVVGVVVETERLISPTENLVAGDVKLGDAKKLPAIYVK